MSEENKRWRCPYCDGLNDWQNTVCEICGDGRRDEADAAVKTPSTAEMPKTYTPPKRRVEPEALRPEPVKESRTAYAPPPPPAPEPPKKKKKGGVWIAIVIVILAALGGRLLANSFVASVEKDKTDEFAVPISAPEATLSAGEAPKATDAPQSAEVEGQGQTVAASNVIARFEVPAEPVASIESITDNGDGTALVRLRSNGCSQTDFAVYSYLLNSPEDSIAGFWSLDDGTIHHRDEYPYSLANAENGYSGFSGSIDDPASIQIIPGHWMQLVLTGLGGFRNSAYWISDPFYIPAKESAPALPLRLIDVKMGVCEGVPLKEGYFVELTTSRALNDLLDSKKDTELGMRYRFQSDFSKETLDTWKSENNNMKCCMVLYAPGFCQIGTRYGVNLSYEDNGVVYMDTPSILSNFMKRKREDVGGYPVGQYTLEVYLEGVSLGSYSFTLS